MNLPDTVYTKNSFLFTHSNRSKYEGFLTMDGENFLFNLSEIQKGKLSNANVQCSERLKKILGTRAALVEDVFSFLFFLYTNFSFQLLHHCSHPEEFINEFKEILSPCILAWKKNNKDEDNSFSFNRDNLHRLILLCKEIESISEGAITDISSDFSKITFLYMFIILYMYI